ncbi:MAG: hypothetical protein ACM3OB_02865 [Acidobacteriota bacterium]
MRGILRIASTWNGDPARVDEQVELALETLPDGDLVIRVRAPFHQDPAPPAGPGPTDRLWEFEVVELFLAGPAAGPPEQPRHPYLEVELGPHGHHLALRFLGVRNPVERALAIACRAEIHGASWEAEVRVAAACLPPRPWSANAFAMHGRGAARRYLAATPLPGARPDFHQPDRFPPLPL